MLDSVINTVAQRLETDRCGVAIIWIGLLFTVALFREMAQHCTAYDEEHTIMRARVRR